MDRVWRLLVTPKWIALTGALLVVVGGFGWLGLWQWHRAHPDPTGPVSQAPARPLAVVAEPGEPLADASVGAQAVTSGRYADEEQLLVPRPGASDEAGYWVLTPLVEPSGSVLPVVRGWSPVASGPAVPPPPGKVTVVGELARSEDSSLRSQVAAPLPEGQVAIVSTAELLSLWDGDLYSGYLVLDEQDPPSLLTAVEPPASARATAVSWQSLAYSLQWWLFAAFAVFFWWRVLLAENRPNLEGVHS